MKAVEREFECMGRKIELIGATTCVAIFIDGDMYRNGVKGIRHARWVALDYCRRHAND
jgi:hypothetical protein